MKKMKLLGMIVAVMFLCFLGEPMEAHAATYTWASNGESANWYQGYSADETMKMDSAPSELTEEDYIFIQTAPDEACAAFLANLSGEISFVNIGNIGDANIVVGKTDGTLNTSIYVTNGYVTFYGKDSSANIAGGNLTIWGNVASLEMSGGNVTVFGNVASLEMGNSRFGTASATGTLTVNGNVEWINWSKQCEDVTQNYNSFTGNAEVTGSVEGGRIVESCYDDSLEINVIVETGEIGKCDEGIFKITDGVLADEVPVTNKEISFDYYNVYSCSKNSENNGNDWKKMYCDYITEGCVTEKECTQEDIPEGAKVIIYSTGAPVVLDSDLSALEVFGGDITVNGNITGVVETTEDGLDKLSVRGPKYDEKCNVSIMGNVNGADVYYEYDPNYNIFIGGNATNSRRIAGTDISYFDCENIQLIKDGIWNENVLIRESIDDDALSYEVIDKDAVEEAVGDETIGQEVVDGETTIVKSVEATIKQTAQDVIDSIAEKDDFIDVLKEIVEKLEETVEEVLEAKPICAIDISIDSFYRDKNTGNVYTANPTYGTENISELPEGKSLEFTVKVPKNHYKDEAKYVVVRQHTKEDGSVQMEQLETTQNGDVLTFKSDKFSTFVIVEVDEKKDTAIVITNVDGAVIKQDGIYGSNGSFSLSGLTAGIYTLNVTRESYVPRTYTVEVEVDSETVEVDVELHKIGDITGDNTINARDKKMLYNHIAGTAELEGYDFAVGDVTGDNVLNARDKKMIYNHIAGTSSLWE